MDGTAAGLERDPRAAVHLFCRTHARITPPGPAVLTVLPELLRQFQDYRMLIYAIVLILVMLATNNDTFKSFLRRLKPGQKKKKEVV